MAATGDEDEETGLLEEEDETSRPFDAIKVAARTPGEHARSHDSGEGLASRVAAAWRQPLGLCPLLPAWLTRRLVQTQEEHDCLLELRQMADVAYDGEDTTHERTLRRFFAAVRGPEEARALPSGGDPRWKEFGFQAEDPRTDFRGGGLLALQNMCHLAENHPEQTQAMMREAGGKRANYLFAAACVNVSSILVLLLGLNSRRGLSPAKGMPCPANALARKNFAAVLGSAVSSGRGTPPEVFGELFAATAVKLHAEWLQVCERKPGATLLDFGEALEATAAALEQLLDTLRHSEQPARNIQSLFSGLDSVQPRHRFTRFQLRFFRYSSAFLEFLCRFIAATAALLGCAGGKPKATEL